MPPAATTATAPPSASSNAPGSGVGAPMSSFDRAMQQYQQSLMPTSSAPARRAKQRGRRHRSGTGGKLLVFVLVAGLLTGGYFLLDWVLRPPIPQFPARPNFGTATIEVVAFSQGAEATIRGEVDASGLVSRSEWQQGQNGAIQVLTDAGYVYLRSGDLPWRRLDRREIDPLLDAPLALMGLMHWRDWVPKEAEKFTSIGGREEVQLGGRALTRFDIVVDARSFAADNLQAFQPWATAVGATPDAPVQFVLYVDEAGIVWQMESGVQGSGSTARITLLSISDTPPMIVYPTQFEDADGRVISLAG